MIWSLFGLAMAGPTPSLLGLHLGYLFIFDISNSCFWFRSWLTFSNRQTPEEPLLALILAGMKKILSWYTSSVFLKLGLSLFLLLVKNFLQKLKNSFSPSSLLTPINAKRKKDYKVKSSLNIILFMTFLNVLPFVMFTYYTVIYTHLAVNPDVLSCTHFVVVWVNR